MLEEGGSAERLAEFELWRVLRPVLEEGGSAKRPAGFDLGRSFNQGLKRMVPCREFQPELGKGGSTMRPVGIDLWPDQGGSAKWPAEIDIWSWLPAGVCPLGKLVGTASVGSAGGSGHSQATSGGRDP